MENIFKHRKNCIELNPANDTFVKEWVTNQTIDKIIRMGPIPFVPYMFYNKLDEMNYEWCGPLIMIVEYFAKFAKTRFNYLLELFICLIFF